MDAMGGFNPAYSGNFNQNLLNPKLKKLLKKKAQLEKMVEMEMSKIVNQGQNNHNFNKSQLEQPLHNQERQNDCIENISYLDPEKVSFPNLIIYFGPNHKETTFKVLKRSFIESGYGDLCKTVTPVSNNQLKVEIYCGRVCLSEGVGDRIESEHIAVCKLLNNLRRTNYVIEAKRSYFPVGKKNFPTCVLEADPNEKHIYKVVYLRKPGTDFPYAVTGAVDYVDSENQLWEYIEDHGKSGSKADLYILNIEKSDRPMVKNICRRTGMMAEILIGCSNRGMKVFCFQSVKEIFDDLQKCGGENLKFKLLSPGSIHEDLKIRSEENVIQSDQELPTDGCSDKPSECKEGSERETHLPKENLGDKEITISPWIADNLIIFETLNRDSVLDSPREILFTSVKVCSNLEKFDVDVKRDYDSRMIIAEAHIDGHVVGRARGFIGKKVKLHAYSNALENLKKCCYYIKVKITYTGTKTSFPRFLKTYNPNSKLYRVIKPDQASTEATVFKTLSQFRLSNVEDYFFLKDIQPEQRNNAEKIGVNLGFKVRQFGLGCICVSKKRSPKKILEELMSTPNKENEKYKLFIPPARTNIQVAAEMIKDCVESAPKLDGLFDFQKEIVLPNTVKTLDIGNTFQMNCGKDSLDCAKQFGQINLDVSKQSVNLEQHNDLEEKPFEKSAKTIKSSARMELLWKKYKKEEGSHSIRDNEQSTALREDNINTISHQSPQSSYSIKNDYSMIPEMCNKTYVDKSEINKYSFVTNQDKGKFRSMADKTDCKSEGYRERNYQEISMKHSNYFKDMNYSFESEKYLPKSELRPARTTTSEEKAAERKYSHPGITNRDPYIEDSSKWRDQEVEIKREPPDIEQSDQLESERRNREPWRVSDYGIADHQTRQSDMTSSYSDQRRPVWNQDVKTFDYGHKPSSSKWNDNDFPLKSHRGKLDEEYRQRTDSYSVTSNCTVTSTNNRPRESYDDRLHNSRLDSRDDKEVDYRQQTFQRKSELKDRGVKRPHDEDELRFEQDIGRCFPRIFDGTSTSKPYIEGVTKFDRTNDSGTSREFKRKPEIPLSSTGGSTNIPKERGNQLWNKNIKSAYDQRPSQVEGAKFESLFDYTSNQGHCDQDLFPPSNSDHYKKKKTRGHNFSKMSKYVNRQF